MLPPEWLVLWRRWNSEHRFLSAAMAAALTGVSVALLTGLDTLARTGQLHVAATLFLAACLGGAAFVLTRYRQPIYDWAGRHPWRGGGAFAGFMFVLAGGDAMLTTGVMPLRTTALIALALGGITFLTAGIVLRFGNGRSHRGGGGAML
jgi:hypothetical protein